MAYDPNNLSVLAYANGFTLWHLATSDTATAVSTAGYFNSAADMLRVGDMILANVEADGVAQAGIFLVNQNGSGVVDVANLTPVGSTDSQ
jgi:hypothetical protein